MEIIRIAGIGLISTILIVILKEIKGEFAILISLVTGVIIFNLIINDIAYIIDTISSLSTRINIKVSYFNTVLKIIGMAYVVEFASQICKDAGQDSIAMKIELGGKVMIMVLAIPILMALMDLILKILP